MPYKNPEKRRQRMRELRQEAHQTPERWEKFSQKEGKWRQTWRNNQTPEDREKRLERRRKIYKQVNPNSQPRLCFSTDQERKDHRRKYMRQYMRNQYKKNKQKMLTYNREYWKNTTQERKDRRRIKQTETSRRWRAFHPENAILSYRKTKMDWTMGIDCRNPKIWKAAEDKAMALAESLGYTDIFQPDFSQFYFDFAARKDGRVAVFQVTTVRTRLVKCKHIDLARYFDLDYMIIHVRPTLDEAYFDQIPTDTIPDKKGIQHHYKKGKLYYLPYGKI